MHLVILPRDEIFALVSLLSNSTSYIFNIHCHDMSWSTTRPFCRSEMQVKQVVLETSRRLGFAIRVLIDVVSNVSFRLLYFNTRKGLPPVTNKILLLSATGKLSLSLDI